MVSASEHFLADESTEVAPTHVASSEHSHVRTSALCGADVTTRGGPITSARYFYYRTHPLGTLKRYSHYCYRCVHAFEVATVRALRRPSRVAR